MAEGRRPSPTPSEEEASWQQECDPIYQLEQDLNDTLLFRDGPATRLTAADRISADLLRQAKKERAQARTLEAQIKGTRQKYDQEISTLTAKSAGSEQNLEKVLNNERTITEKYNTLAAQAENVVKIAKERDQLRQENKKLTSGIKVLQEKNDEIADSRMIKWFLAGGGVFFFGWIIGRISRKKRSRF